MSPTPTPTLATIWQPFPTGYYVDACGYEAVGLMTPSELSYGRNTWLLTLAGPILDDSDDVQYLIWWKNNENRWPRSRLSGTAVVLNPDTIIHAGTLRDVYGTMTDADIAAILLFLSVQARMRVQFDDSCAEKMTAMAQQMADEWDAESEEIPF